MTGSMQLGSCGDGRSRLGIFGGCVEDFDDEGVAIGHGGAQ